MSGYMKGWGELCVRVEWTEGVGERGGWERVVKILGSCRGSRGRGVWLGEGNKMRRADGTQRARIHSQGKQLDGPAQGDKGPGHSSHAGAGRVGSSSSIRQLSVGNFKS